MNSFPNVTNYHNSLSPSAPPKNLNRMKYINQLARMDYEQKTSELYSRQSRISKDSVAKKFKSKNQIAEFDEEEQDIDYQELMDFKYGKEKYHFEAQELAAYQFCALCDTIHNEHQEVHKVLCDKVRRETPELYSQFAEGFREASQQRIAKTLSMVTSREYQELTKSINSKGEVDRLMKIYRGDQLFCQIANKARWLLG